MDIFRRVALANKAALNTWVRVYSDPSKAHASGQYQPGTQYNLLWQYYTAEALEDRATWAAYRGRYGLYRNTRQIYNPVRRLVNFYAGAVYPGPLVRPGEESPGAMPLPDDTPVALVEAIAQCWQWWNWQAQKAALVRFGAALGDVLVELVDDVDGGRVYPNVIWPGFVTDLRLDAQGNVKLVEVEYQTSDEDGRPYTYLKHMDGDRIEERRNGQTTREESNRYGFVPAVWVRHVADGGDHGQPAISGSIGKMDELNSLASHVHDQVHRVIAAPVILWTAGQVGNLFEQGKRLPTDRLAANEDRESLLMLKGPEGGRTESLAGSLDLSAALPYIQSLLGEIEADHPELNMYAQLRAMSQVTGPGAQRLLGDVDNLVGEVSAGYDQQVVKLFQMALAIGGWRAQSGAWSGGQMSSQQQKFLPFNLDSYARGELDFRVLPRPLIPLTDMERIMNERAKLALEGDRMAGQNPVGIEQRIVAQAAAKPGSLPTGQKAGQGAPGAVPKAAAE